MKEIRVPARELAYDIMCVAGAGKLCGDVPEQADRAMAAINEVLRKYCTPAEIEAAKIQIHRHALEALV